MSSLLIKGTQIVISHPDENSFNRYFDANSFEFWIFMSLNISLIIGLIWSAGNQFILSICLLVSIAMIFVEFSRRLSNETGFTVMLMWLTLLPIFFIEVGWLVFQVLLTLIKNLTDPMLFFWAYMAPLFLLFLGIGTAYASMFILIWLIIAGRQRDVEIKTRCSWASLCEIFSHYRKPFQDDIRMTFFLGLIILMGIGILLTNSPSLKI